MRLRFLLVLGFSLGQSACLKSLALSSVADALSGTGGAFSRDPDPELVGDAVPFALKTMEALMPQLPDHWPLRLAACSGFTQYAYAFVITPAKAQAVLAQERAGIQRGKAMLLRARGYCLDALELKHPGTRKKLDPAKLDKDDLPLMYWLSASTALAISSAKDQVDLVPEMPAIDALIRRALQLDPDWDRGTLQELLIAWDGSRSETMGGSAKRARAAFKRAVELSGGKRLGPYVSLAESVSVSEQNKKEFEALLKQALSIDLNAAPDDRLANAIARRRAERLLAQADELILGD